MGERKGTVEDLAIDPSFWKGRRVFLTGHTGFKGGWLSFWLSEMGADVHGYALAPPTRPSFFDVSGVQKRLASSTIADIRDANALTSAMAQAKPEVVFHLAAQPLVRRSYADPVDTFTTNVIGTVNVLEAARASKTVRALVNVTTDKCYDNREWYWPYRENDPLGGHDPYSASKACAELVTACYRTSFFAPAGMLLASARAGNVVGGGDWAEDRLVPDILKAFDAERVLSIRSPSAIRPWQHVLEPLSGYLLLAQRMLSGDAQAAGAWNFGPAQESARDVRTIVEFFSRRIAGSSWTTDDQPRPHEAGRLELDSSRARALLGWRPRWSIEETLGKTLDWHMAWRAGADMAAITRDQIADFTAQRGAPKS